MYCKFSITLILFVLSFFKANAQEFTYVHYDEKNGLADNYVYHAVQDHDGFIWFATANGVSRFDGKFFENFTAANGLPNNEILKLFVDSKNRVWMMPFKNSICYYYKNKIYNATNDSLLAKINLSNNPTAIDEDADGDIAISGINSFVCIKTSNKTILPIIVPEGNNNVGLDKNKNFVITFFNKLKNIYEVFGINKKTNQLELLPIKLKGNAEKNVSNKNLLKGEQFFEISIANFASSVISYYNLKNNLKLDTNIYSPINTFSNISENTVHLNTKRGSIEWRFNKDKKSINYLPSESIAHTFKDKEDNLWFTSLGGGVFRLVSDKIKNLKFQNQEAIKNQLYAVFSDGKQVIAGSGEKKIYTIVDEKPKVDIDISTTETGRILKILKHKNRYYFLFELGLFYTYDFIQYYSVINKNNASYKDMDISANGMFYFATSSSLLQSSESNLLDKYNILTSKRIMGVCVVDDFVYFSALNGLNRIDLKTNKIEELGKLDVLLQNRISKLIYHNKLLWIGTGDNGLLCFDGKKIIKNVSIKDGLTSNIITALFVHNNYIYVGTDKGLNKIALNDNNLTTISQITTQNGLPTNKINGICELNNYLYLATPVGLSYFYDSSFTEKSTCDLNITSIIVNGLIKTDSLPI